MPHVSRFKKKFSDRSGFDYREIELVKEGGWKVAQDEFDIPPPSKKPLGGEGDTALGEARSGGDFSSISSVNTPPGYDNPVNYITASGGITPRTDHPFMLISGSNSTVDITANPQIVRGREGQILTLLCADSSVTIDHGTGVNLMGSGRFIMTSGAIMSLMYNTANNAWNETTRSRRLGE